MSKVKSPTAIKTEKARKIDARNRIEMDNIRAIAEYLSDSMPKTVKDAMRDSHERVNAQRQQCIDRLSPSVELLLSGNHSTDIIMSISRLCNEMQPQITW